VILVDASVWIDVLRDRSGQRGDRLRTEVADDALLFARWTQFELLAGARDEVDWLRLETELSHKPYAELTAALWRDSARIAFDLRRRGLTVRSAADLCLAQTALDHDALVLHRDSDFATIAQVRPLRQRYLQWDDTSR
jgi:predicted nucleic acid-binding protein